MITLALDVMGGDHAPREILLGVRQAQSEIDARLMLVGPGALVAEELRAIGVDPRAFEIVDAPELVSFHEDPGLVRDRKAASIRVVCDLVKAGRAQAALTMGHTGAGVMAALITFGRLGHVTRPGVAVPYFDLQPKTIFLDAGAIVDCKPEQLLDFARMGSIYVEKILGVPAPTVALMSNGHEDNKGNQVTRAAFELLKASGLNFVGNVEGYDLPRGKANVIVMDGFVGNVALKMTEALAEELYMRLVRRLAEDGQTTPLRIVEEERAGMDYSHIGAMPVLGVDGLLLIGHGRSQAPAVVGGLRSALRAVQVDLIGALREGLAA